MPDPVFKAAGRLAAGGEVFLAPPGTPEPLPIVTNRTATFSLKAPGLGALLELMRKVERDRHVVLCHPDQLDTIREQLAARAGGEFVSRPVVYAAASMQPDTAVMFPRRVLCPMLAAADDGPCQICPASGACEELSIVPAPEPPPAEPDVVEPR